jgi:methylase of polypeptide subunit release factors
MKTQKEQIKKLIEKYEKLSDKEIKDHNEQQTKDRFIRPLFEALGWDFTEDVWSETDVAGKRVDYAFKTNGITKFFVEAKSLKTDLDLEIHARQAVNYSWNKGVDWAVLTDFESVKIYNAQAQSKNLLDKLVFEIPYKDFISDFERLSLLSKESFLKNALEEYAVKHGKKLKKLSVNEKLYSDLKEMRKALTDGFSAWNKTVDKEILEEGIQRIIERLMFIRVLEDRKLEDPVLNQILREWEKNKNIQLFSLLIAKFRELDEIYNSNLFSEHACEKWEEYSVKWDKIFSLLYGSNVYEYDFKEIPADILGGVYESYLGYIAQNPINEGHKAGKLFELDDKSQIKMKSRAKRKEQGIYYTPKFIVDYIVKNTLGEKLEEIKSVNDLKKIKILDPACGSGSFLTRVLEEMNNKYKDFGNPGNQYTKTEILLNNIYGVDLDSQATELAKLNLLLDTLDEKAKLPTIKNIRVGNSLISGSDEELEKYFGKNFRDKKPFNWEEEFGGGGFDVIIGNPPYIRNRELDEKDKEFFNKIYYSSSGQYDIYQLFFERSISLLKEDGFLGFITSNKYAIADYGKKLREFILDNCKVVSIVDVSNLQVFKDASTYPYIIILQKNKNNSGHKIKGYKIESEDNLFNNEVIINQDEIKNSDTKNFVIKEEMKFLKDIENKSVKLGEIATIKETIHTGNVRKKLIADEKIDETCKKLLAGRDCHRYYFKWGGKYIRYNKGLIDKSKKEYGNLVEEKYFNNPKIFLREIASNIECCYDDQKYYSLNKVYSVQSRNEYNLKYLLILLNSKLLSFYFRNKFEEAHIRGGYLQFKKIYTSQIPIYKIDFSNKKEKAKHDESVELADKILDLNKQLQSIPEHSNKWDSVKKEIEKTDREIDERVYELYGLGEEEKKVVEGK